MSAAPTPGTVHFTAGGDFAATANASAVLNSIGRLGSDLTLALGDFSYGVPGEEPAWCDFVRSRIPAGHPFELVSGNHESDGRNGNIDAFTACLPNRLPGVVGRYGREYYVDVPTTNPLVRFVMISPGLTFPEGKYDYSAGSPRYQWTARAIDGARSAGVPWVVVGMHKPCITVGKYHCDPGADIVNLLLSKKVDLVLSGHEHTYQRSKQLAVRAGCPAVTPGSYNASCVVDSDSQLTKGAGTVSMVVGTGGNTLYDISATDTEAGYFAATSGANRNPTYGLLDVSATADRLTASFARAAGGTFSDSFTITRPAAPAPNPRPVATFSSSCTGLACTFDAAGSRDDDPITYRWDFGDGASATTVRPTHTYAAAGSYPVRLTVTDREGASTAASRTVTAGASTPPAYAADSFSRTTSSGFGTAPTGGSWSHSGDVGIFSVGNGVGAIRTGAGQGPSAQLANVSVVDVDLRMSFSLDKVPVGRFGMFVSVLARRTSAGAYVAKARITPAGSVGLDLTRRSPGGPEVAISPVTAVPGLTYASGDVLNVRMQTLNAGTATMIRAKVWKAGAAEPSNWQSSATDSTAGLQGAGGVGISPHLASSVTNGPVTIALDNLLVTAP